MVGSPVFSLLALRTTYSSEFILTCPSSSLPPLSATWLRNGEPVSTGGDNFHTWRVLVDPSTTGYANSLRVSGNLAGEYQCSVGNSEGTTNASLLVRGEPASYYIYTVALSLWNLKPLELFPMRLVKSACSTLLTCNSDHDCQNCRQIFCL